jgi:small subunit ribosomal protein S20
MANIKSAIKRIKKTEARTMRNKAVRTRTRTATRAAVEAIGAGNAGTAAEAVRQAISVIDRAAKKGVIHRNAAARRKSRLAKQLAQIEAR